MDMDSFKKQMLDMAIRFKLVKDGGSTPSKSSSSNQSKISDPNKVTFKDAWNNFQKDLPTWGDQLSRIVSWRQDKLIAFACLVLGLILLIAGIIVIIL